MAVKARYSDAVDYRQYEPQIQKLIDTHVTATEVIQLTEQVNIFEQEQFDKEVEKVVGKAARADMIATRTAKTINEKMEGDPAFYKKFSKLLQETIAAYRKKRFDDAEYLNKVTDIMERVRNRTDEDTPQKLQDKEEAKAFYGIAYEVFQQFENNDNVKEVAADMGIKIDEIIQKHLVVDWQRKQDVQNHMKQEIEDCLYELKEQGIDLTFEQMDKIIDDVVEVAKHRY